MCVCVSVCFLEHWRSGGRHFYVNYTLNRLNVRVFVRESKLAFISLLTLVNLLPLTYFLAARNVLVHGAQQTRFALLAGFFIFYKTVDIHSFFFTRSFLALRNYLVHVTFWSPDLSRHSKNWRHKKFYYYCEESRGMSNFHELTLHRLENP